MIYKRQFYIYAGWRNFLLPIIFILGPIILMLSLNVFILNGILEQPVNQSLFGKYFVWIHICIILIFIFGITLIMLMTKKSAFFQHHAQFLMQQEKVDFMKKYHIPKDKIDAITLRPSYFYIILMVLSTFLPVIVIIPYKILLPHLYSEGLAATIGFIIMAVPFYYFFKKIIKKNNISTQPILDQINAKLPETNLKNNAADLNYSISNPGVQINQGLHGRFKKYDVNFQIDLNAFANIQHTNIKGKIKASLHFNQSLHQKNVVTITEKKLKWKKIIGNTIDECFEKRFATKGESIANLPQKFKELCLMNDRPLFFSYNQNKIKFNSTKTLIYPAYSIYGEVLFLDFMVSLADSLIEN